MSVLTDMPEGYLQRVKSQQLTDQDYKDTETFLTPYARMIGAFTDEDMMVEQLATRLPGMLE